jgi:hypothetical protein
MVQDRPFVSAKPLGLGVVREMPSLLAEWADPVITQPMSFQILLLSYSVQHTRGSTDIFVNQQQPSAGGFCLGHLRWSPVKITEWK